MFYGSRPGWPPPLFGGASMMGPAVGPYGHGVDFASDGDDGSAGGHNAEFNPLGFNLRFQMSNPQMSAGFRPSMAYPMGGYVGGGGLGPFPPWPPGMQERFQMLQNPRLQQHHMRQQYLQQQRVHQQRLEQQRLEKQRLEQQRLEQQQKQQESDTAGAPVPFTINGAFGLMSPDAAAAFSRVQSSGGGNYQQLPHVNSMRRGRGGARRPH